MAIYLDQDQFDRLAAQARAEGRSLSQLGARLVIQGLGRSGGSAGPVPAAPRGPLVPGKAAAAEPVLEPVE